MIDRMYDALLARLKEDFFTILDAWWEEYEERHHGPIYKDQIAERDLAPKMQEHTAIQWLQEWEKLS